jgi:hypothetical protein
MPMQKPEALTTSGQLFIQKYKTHDNSNLQPARGGQFNLTKCGQGQWLFQLRNTSAFLFWSKTPHFNSNPGTKQAPINSLRRDSD